MAKIKVACVGNSVTYGMTLIDREKQCYPAQLQAMLGNDYEVKNFGHSGATLLNHGHRPYQQQQEFKDALSFKADLVIIHLGLNDTDPRNWSDYSDEFNGDYLNLIQQFKAANPKTKVWICLMTPIFDWHSRFESSTRDWYNAIQQHILQVASLPDVGLIDLNTPLCNRPDLFADAIHPNAEGAGIIAQTVYKALTGDYGGFRLNFLYTDNMVVQQGKPIVFEGIANAGEIVKVRFNNQFRTVTTGINGRWNVSFPPLKAGGPYQAEFKTSRHSKQIITNIYVGEVWLCSGQSNMEFPVAATECAEKDLSEADNQHFVHLFNMPAIYPTANIRWSKAACDSVNRHQYQKKGPWTICTKSVLKDFSAVAYHFGKALADSLQVPVGIICNAVGGTTTESWIDRKTLENNLSAILSDWYHKDFGHPWARERALFNIQNSSNKLQRHPYQPAYMFESGMLPLKNYEIKGVVWYQGESNAHNIELHERLFPLLQKSWRAFFNQPRLPFYFAQLSSLNRKSWGAFRASQYRMSQCLPNTYMAVTSDLGDSLDVHYRNKKPVGERLARQALHHTYGFNLVSEGPKCVKALQEEASVRLLFTNVEVFKPANSPIIGFEVAGSDGIFYPVKAEMDGKTIVLKCEKVREPVMVRYAWQPFTRANLANQVGLPCSTFQKEIEK